jgi:hypothetical protein
MIAVIINFRKPNKTHWSGRQAVIVQVGLKCPIFYVREVSYFLKKTIHLFVVI